jgi:hypothetical protein
LPCSSELHHVESEVVRLNDRGQRAALAQWEDVAIVWTVRICLVYR